MLLIYRVPSEPSRLRAMVWRRLKAAGAIYLANSVAALPESASAERAMRKLRAEVEEMGGSGQLLRADTLVGSEQIVAGFNAARNAEYAELLGRCEDFHAELEKETKAEKFTYAELEENEEDLAKLRAWLDKISARDTLDAPRGVQAREAAEACAEALNEFAERVYAAELDHHSSPPGPPPGT
ncbi:Chromate resistance protein ChrB [Nocardiopsis salina]|uniref:Chromate resistance protein ChrB n=1 Tax=Nocardiopsis salina TaxID=245836 RepID=UPI0019553B69|nr:Chromate resistance protein ChrB [Nocardiopsis salina]